MDSEKEKKLWLMVFKKNNSIYNNKDFNFIINKSLIQYERILKKINIIINNNKINNLKKSKKGKTSEKSRKSKKGKTSEKSRKSKKGKTSEKSRKRKNNLKKIIKI